ncbi:MAG: hypothetical protein H7Y02_09565 [Candidatus Obscuribacterales bacterium]|nr:hypothetical protein [Steroidobacteraceae bacterium]
MATGANNNGMGDRMETSRKISASREQLRQLLEGQRTEVDPDANSSFNEFPRSKTLRFLRSNSAIGVAAAIAGGILLMKPGLAARAIRLVPVNTLVRMLAVRLLSQRGNRS